MFRVRVWEFLLGVIMAASPCVRGDGFSWQPGGPGLAMIRLTNAVPVIYSAVRIEREQFNKDLTLITTLASNSVVGTETLEDQIKALPKDLGMPVAAMNADFFMMSGSAKGDPRGLHIWNGELVSTPAGSAAFWMDDGRELHGKPVTSKLTITWPGGGTHRAGLNEELGTNTMVLFTPRLGTLYPPTNARPASVGRPGGIVRPPTAAVRTTNSTPRTNVIRRPGNSGADAIPKGGAIRPPGGREWILEPAGAGPWLPLRVGQTYQARAVASVDGFTNVPDSKLILSLGSNFLAENTTLTGGTIVTINVATDPDLSGLQHALGTGPMLVRAGKIYDISARMSEQLHPRAALGWNDRFLFFAVSDGRRKGVSEGIKLSEMAAFMIALGCDEAINLDGGQSTTLMLNGAIVNAQTPGGKHEVANGIAVLRKPPADDNDGDK